MRFTFRMKRKKKLLRENVRKALLPHLNDTDENKIVKLERTKAIETARNLNKEKYNYNLEEIINYIAAKVSTKEIAAVGDRNMYEIKERLKLDQSARELDRSESGLGIFLDDAIKTYLPAEIKAKLVA